MELGGKSLCPVRIIGTLFPDHFIHDIVYKRIKYNNPSFATTSQRAFYSTLNITTCFGLHNSHHQVLSYKEDQNVGYPYEFQRIR
jgi:hypothetical protein